MRRLGLAVLLAAVVSAGLHWGTFVAGGSDSFCYLHQAERWASGRLQVPEPLALEAPWPDAPLTFAPAGHRPSATVPGAIVPICPSGLSMAMAPLVLLGGPVAAFLVVPLFGALLVGATYALGARFGARVGFASALVVSASPVFLYQLVQPMSDVPAAALWTAAAAAVTSGGRRAGPLGGLVAGLAVLMRPNLAPLAVPLGAYLLWRPEHSARDRWGAAASFAACAAPGAIAVAFVQKVFYGSPLASGYGSLDTLFSVAHITPNLARYGSWLVDVQTPALLLAAAAPALLPGALTRLLAGLAVVNAACYLPYVVFDDWSYLRFLLPALPPLIVLGIASLDALCRRTVPWLVRPAVAAAAIVLVVSGVREAETRGAFRLHVLEARYERGGRFVDARLPANAVIVTSSQSGSVRFYSGRRTVVWDVLDPEWLDRAIVYLRQRGLEPYLLFEPREEPMFRQRFASSPLGRLDWPPAAEIGGRVRIYRPDDRERYFRDEPIATEYAR